MANIKSQKKRVLTNNKANAINNSKKTRVKNAIKKYNALIEAKDIAAAEALLPEVVSIIDHAKSDGVYHQNTASRKIGSLSKALDSLKKA